MKEAAIMDGWNVLHVIAGVPGARVTLLFSLVAIAVSPRAFAVVGAIAVLVHLAVYG